MAIGLKFGAPSESFQAKHGKFYCTCCRIGGVRTPATFIIRGTPNSVTFKREFACCDEHLAQTRQAALRRIQFDRDDHESEGMYQARTTFGV